MIDELEQQISTRADDAATRFQEPSGGRLDFSEASVAAVDALVAEIAEFIADVPQDQAEGLVQDFGCYLFETARRTFGGKYYWMQEHQQPVLVVGNPEFTVGLIAFTRVRGRLRSEVAEPLPVFFSGFAERVRSAQPGDDAFFM